MSFPDLRFGGGVSVDLTAPGPIGGVTPNTGAFTGLTVAQGTLTDPATGLALTATWNDAADTFNVFTCNVTNTASAAASRLLNLQVGGAAKVAADTNGLIYLNGSTAGSIGRRSDVDMLMLHSVGFAASAGVLGIGSSYNIGLNLSQNAALSWTLDTPASSRDIILTRPAAGVLSLSTGRLRLPNLPTSTAGLTTGDLWNDGGTVKIV